MKMVNQSILYIWNQVGNSKQKVICTLDEAATEAFTTEELSCMIIKET